LKAVVYHLDTLRAVMISQIEPRDTTTNFYELIIFYVARERGPGRVVGDPGAGPLIVVNRILLGGGDRGRRPGDAAQVQRSRDLVAAAEKAVPEVDGPHVGATV